MKNLFTKIIATSLALAVLPMISCGKTNTEKTTTIIRENDAPKSESGFEIKVGTDKNGISVQTSQH